jgi:hypothetical protein
MDMKVSRDVAVSIAPPAARTDFGLLARDSLDNFLKKVKLLAKAKAMREFSENEFLVEEVVGEIWKKVWSLLSEKKVPDIIALTSTGVVRLHEKRFGAYLSTMISNTIIDLGETEVERQEVCSIWTTEILDEQPSCFIPHRERPHFGLEYALISLMGAALSSDHHKVIDAIMYDYTGKSVADSMGVSRSTFNTRKKELIERVTTKYPTISELLQAIDDYRKWK